MTRRSRSAVATTGSLERLRRSDQIRGTVARMIPSSKDKAAQISFSPAQQVYLWLSALFVASVLVADVLGVKLFRIPLGFSFHVPWQDDTIDAIQHTCGMLTFPITFLLTDLINEFYGKRAARRLVWIGF